MPQQCILMPWAFHYHHSTWLLPCLQHQTYQAPQIVSRVVILSPAAPAPHILLRAASHQLMQMNLQKFMVMRSVGNSKIMC